MRGENTQSMFDEASLVKISIKCEQRKCEQDTGHGWEKAQEALSKQTFICSQYLLALLSMMYHHKGAKKHLTY